MHLGVNALFLIPSEVGGTEVILIETLKAFCRANASWKVSVFTNCENQFLFKTLAESFSQIKTVPLNFKASNRVSRILREQLQLPAAIQESEIDLLWSPGYTGPIFVSVPHVVSIPDVQYESHPEDLEFLARFTTHVLVSAVAKRSQAIVTLSEFSKSEITRYYRVARNKVFVSYCGVDDIYFKTSAAQIQHSQLLNLIRHQKPYLLCVANSYPHKNLGRLVEAFVRLESQIPHHLVIIGRARRGEDSINSCAQKLKNPERFLRIEFIPHEQLPQAYRNASLFVFPSLYEGFGLPVLEAMASGAPVLTTSFGSIPEVGGDCVFYCDGKDVSSIENAIKRALTLSDEERSNLKKRMKERSLRFKWGHSAEILKSAFTLAVAR